jgi:transposase
MLQITPQMRILVAVEAVDFRKGIDSLAELCRAKLNADPFSGCLFVFRSRRATSIKVLVYDGQGFWLATKRLSKGRFRWWPATRTSTQHRCGGKCKPLIFCLRSERFSGTLRMRWSHIATGVGTSPAKRSCSSGN